MRCVKDLINNDERFPFGDNSPQIYERYHNDPDEPADKELWISQLNSVIETSTDLLKDFGIEDDEIVNPDRFAYMFREITGYGAEMWLLEHRGH